MSPPPPGRLGEQLWEISHAASEQAALTHALSLAHDATGAERCMVLADDAVVLGRGFAEAAPPVSDLARLVGRAARRGAIGDWGVQEVCVAALECEPRMWLIACREDGPFDLRERERASTIAHVLSTTLAMLRRGRERDEQTRARLSDRALLEADLRGGIERGEMRLLYQPVVTVAESELIAVEALVRWAHPRRGLLGPGEFIPLAEQSDLIVELGTWVIEEACAQIRRWRDAHPAGLGVRVSVNVSARQLHPALLDTVTDALARHGVDPGLLALEITETMLVGGAAQTREVLDALAATGVAIVLDDFGTGYSSLSYLRELPLQQLKLDRSFCAGLEDDLRAAKIVAATIEMARALGLTIVAEGVETLDQLTVLRRLGSDFAQGFWFARPEPAEAVLTRLVDAYDADSRVAALDGAVEVRTSAGPAALERRHGDRRRSPGRRADDHDSAVVSRAPNRTELGRLAADALHTPAPDPGARASQRASLGRLAGWMFLAGSVIALPADYFMHAPSVLSVILLTLMGLITGGICLALPWQRLPDPWLHAVAALATLEITTSVVVVGPRGTMLASFYALVATIVAYGFRDRRAIALQTALILAARVIPPILMARHATEAIPGSSVGALITVSIVTVVVFLRERLEGTADRLRELAEHDPLTEVGNYRLLHDRLGSELARHRDDGRTVSVLLVDLDRFKQVNERLGHAAGDDVLRRVARTLHDAVRAQDTVARPGGDEFAVLAPDTDAEGAAMLAGRLRQRLRRLQFAGEAIDATIGWAVCPADGDTPQALLAQADSRLLGAKRTAERALPSA